MHDYCSWFHRLCGLIIIGDNFSENCCNFIFKKNNFQPNSFSVEMCFIEERYKKMGKKKSNFDNFESVFFMKSGSMPLSLKQVETNKNICDDPLYNCALNFDIVLFPLRRN